MTPDVGKIGLTAAQIAAGEYELTGLTTGTAYTVELLRDEAVRGTVTFVASDKIDVDVTDKTAASITLSWGADQRVTSLALKGGDDERDITLTGRRDRLAYLYFRGPERAHRIFDHGLHRRRRIGQSGRHDPRTVQLLGFHDGLGDYQLGIEPDHRRPYDPRRFG